MEGMEHASYLGVLAKWTTGRRSKWLTLFIWIFCTVVASLAFPAANRVESNNASYLPNSAPSVQAEQRIEKNFPASTGTPALVVWYDSQGLTNKDIEIIKSVSERLESHPVASQIAVPPLASMPAAALAPWMSKDKTTLVLPITLKSSATQAQLHQAVVQIQHVVDAAAGSRAIQGPLSGDGLHVRITGPAGIAVDAVSLFQHADFALLMATTLLVLALLIVMYRSPILAFVPLVTVGIAYGLISPILGELAAHHWITFDAQTTSIMTVLLFGAGTDYCLLMVARYREQLYQSEDKYSAIRKAVGGSAGAIAMSGLTVALALLSLLFARYQSYHEFAVPFCLAIAIIALAGVTLLPALLAILGRVAFFPFIPRPDAGTKATSPRPSRVRRGEPGALSRWVGHTVTSRSGIVTTLGMLILIGLGLFTFQIRTTYSLISSFPPSMPSREGYAILSEHFAKGALAPVELLVPSDSAQAVTKALKDEPYIDTAYVAATNTHNRVALVDITLATDPYSNTAMADLARIRSVAEKALDAQSTDSAKHQVWISGPTATQADTKALTNRDTGVVVPIVIGMIALLLCMYLRSIVAVVYLIVTVVLSYLGALGAGWLVIHYALGSPAIQGAIPLYAFVFLVALGEDYNIFVLSRIWQAKGRVPHQEAIEQAVSATSGVITSAGLILAGTFAVLASLPIQVLVQFGIVSAIGVLLDTFVVRPFIVPAITSLCGRFAYWPSYPSAKTNQ